MNAHMRALLSSFLALFLFYGLADTARSVAAKPEPLPIPSADSLMGFSILVLNQGEWQTAGELHFNRHFKKKALDLAPLPSNENISKIRLIQEGGGAAQIDTVSLGGHAPNQIEGLERGGARALGLRKLAARDFDVIDASGAILELSFPRESAALSSGSPRKLEITARVEPKDVHGPPFKFPVANARLRGESFRFFYTYRLGEGSLEAPFFREFSPTGSGHPSGFTYGYVTNDGQSLRVRLDFTPANTWDGERDYAAVHVKLGSQVKTFKVTAFDNRWGSVEFAYTDNVAYQHKQYEFEIPLRELEIAENPVGELKLAFSLYGTASPLPFQGDEPALAFNPLDTRYLGAFRTTNAIKGHRFDCAMDLVGEPFDISGSEVTDHGIHASADPSREVLTVIWARDDFSGNTDLLYLDIPTEGFPTGPPLQVPNLDSGIKSEPKMACNASGICLLVFQQLDPTGIANSVWGVIRNQGSWEGEGAFPIFPIDVSSSAGVDATFDRTKEHFLVATALNQPDGVPIVGQQVGTDGGLIGLPFPISENGDFNFRPSLASSDNSIIASWTSFGTLNAVKARVFTGDQPLGSQLIVSEGLTDTPGISDVEFDGVNFNVLFLVTLPVTQLVVPGGGMSHLYDQNVLPSGTPEGGPVCVSCPHTELTECRDFDSVGNGVGGKGIVCLEPDDPDGFTPVAFGIGEPCGINFAEIELQKHTNGQDADEPPGPSIQAGDVVVWSYIVTNTGTLPLTSVMVTDDRGVSVDCGDFDGTLEPGESHTCTATGTVTEGQYQNIGDVEANASDGSFVTDSDPSHHTGTPPPQPGIDLEKSTNTADADDPPGPTIRVGQFANWEYQVTNTGDVPLSSIVVTDSQGVTVTCEGFDGTLDPDESVTCRAGSPATAGQYMNEGSVQGVAPDGSTVSDSDPSHYFGEADAPAIDLEKLTNDEDADDPTGPVLGAGDPVTWTYVVTNTGNVRVKLIVVTDDQGVLVNCPKGDLIRGESMTCTAMGVAVEGQYGNLGTVTGTAEDEASSQVSDTDPSHYQGVADGEPGVKLTKFTNGVDAPSPPGPLLLAGSQVIWTYQVTNTGNVTLSSVAVTDDHEGKVKCPKTTLAPGESTFCTAKDKVDLGQYENAAGVTAVAPSGKQVSDGDVSHYFGVFTLDPEVQIVKLTNNVVAPNPPGPTVIVGSQVRWTYVVLNSGGMPLSGIKVTDDQGVVVTCPGTTLGPDREMTCLGSGTIQEGEYKNTVTVEAFAPDGTKVMDSDTSHAFGATEDPIQERFDELEDIEVKAVFRIELMKLDEAREQLGMSIDRIKDLRQLVEDQCGTVAEKATKDFSKQLRDAEKHDSRARGRVSNVKRALDKNQISDSEAEKRLEKPLKELASALKSKEEARATYRRFIDPNCMVSDTK